MNQPWIAYGSNVVETLTGFRLPILKIRGSLLPVRTEIAEDKWLVASIHPAFLVRGGGKDNPDGDEGKAQDELKPLLGCDARRAIESLTPKIPRCVWQETPRGSPPSGALVSVDIEGANGRPNIVGVSWDEGEAFVFPWSEDLRLWLTELFRTNVPTFHNASFDVAELEEAGVTPPLAWYDTINMAALYDPDQPMNLQTQVLTHVPGSITWKGLVDHAKGPDFEAGQVGVYRELWRSCLRALGGRSLDVPSTGSQWYQFYNGLDTAWGLALANQLKRKLIAQGRWDYYTEVLMPLQRPLLEIGKCGMPVDETKVAEHRVACQAKVDEASAVLVAAGQKMIEIRNGCLQDIIDQLESERLTEQALTGKRGFSKAKDLTKIKNKLKPKKSKTKAGIKVKDPNVFDPSSNPQRCALLYDWYGLPPIKNYGAKGFTTDEKAVLELLNRLERGTIKPKRGTVEEVKPVLQAMTDINQWGVLISTFLTPELR